MKMTNRDYVTAACLHLGVLGPGASPSLGLQGMGEGFLRLIHKQNPKITGLELVHRLADELAPAVGLRRQPVAVIRISRGDRATRKRYKLGRAA
jgi:hypothetical protein